MPDPFFLSHKPEHPTVLFDGDCGFCRRCIGFWQARSESTVYYAPYQEAQSLFPEIPTSALAEAVHFIEPDGRCTRGAEAVFRVLAQRPQNRWMVWLYDHVPGIRPVTEFGYRLVAHHRPFFSRVTRSVLADDVSPRYEKVRTIFLRGLALIYAVAFASLFGQLLGLVGHDGIFPADQLMKQVHAVLGWKFYQFPTLAWLGTSDHFLLGLCAAGLGLSVFAFLDMAPALLFFLLWLFYLSFVTIGGQFLNFQWDALLLETGLLGFLWAPLRWLPRQKSDPPPHRLVLWVLRLLLFRLMLQSGLVKLLSHDPTWAHWTALRVYYETMPIPNPLSWWMHQAPPAFQTVSVGFLFFVELILPWFIFTPWRRFAAWGFVTLQALILLTGNYGFFNLLTMLLCLTLFTDQQLGSTGNTIENGSASRSGWHRFQTVAAGGLLLAAFGKFVLFFGIFLPFEGVFMLTEPFHSINNYGLFAVMTTTRPEIIIEGSDDGTTWKPYDFFYKAQSLERRPPLIAPFQPRLDWQMWFAALRSYGDDGWFLRFCQQLLLGSPDVLKLLRTNPFPDHPPKYLRALQYQYHFTTIAERRRTGQWWKRELEGPYSPVLSLKASNHP